MHIKFAKLPVADQDRTKEFYTKNLGCSVGTDSSYEEGGWRWIDLKFGNAGTMLHFDKRQDDSDSDDPVLVLVDPALDDTVATLKANGADIITERKEAPWNSEERFAEFRDSEGNRMVLTTG